MTAARQLIVTLGSDVVLASTVSREIWKIGRLPDNDLVLPDAAVSPYHAEIRIEASRAFLTDLDSESGTFSGPARLLPLQPNLLVNGAAFRIGPYDVSYRSQIDADTIDDEAPTARQDDPVAEALHEIPALTAAAAAVAAPFALAGEVTRGAGANAGAASSRYVAYLPVIFHDNDFLSRFLQIFETIWEPLEQRQDHIAMFLSPRTCPASWLPWFASWFGLPVNEYLPEVRTRALLAEALEIYRWRGTKYGLARVIEVCTGVRPEITERPSEPHVFHVAIRLPAGARGDVVMVIRDLINAHKPAHAGYVLEVQG